MALGVPSAVSENTVNSKVLAASGAGSIVYLKCTNNASAARWYYLVFAGSAPTTVNPTNSILIGTSTSGDVYLNNTCDGPVSFDAGATVVVCSDSTGTVATTSNSNVVSYVQTRT